MSRRRFTLRSSHLLMWSSPLLLLVLVFTLNSRPLHPSPASATSTTSTAATARTTSTSTSTTSTTRPPSTTSSTTTAPPVTTSTTPPPVATTTTSTTTTSEVTTTTRVPSRSAGSTTTSVAASGPLARRNYDGWLTLAAPAALVPLHGPGQWTLHATHDVISTLQCGSQRAVLTNTVALARRQNCTLDITINTGAATQWTLRAAP